MSDAIVPATPPTEPARERTILIVDDEHGVRDVMTRWLESVGYSVTAVGSADDALAELEASPAAVALCDIRMPGRDGMWLAERIRRRHPETAVIMATGVQDVSAAVDSLRQGVIDYLTKPFGRDRLREAVVRGLEWHEAAWDARRWRESLEKEIDVRRARLVDAIAASKIEDDDRLDAMLAMVTLTDREAYGHAYRVAALSLSLGRILRVPEDELSTLEHGALLHDLGKLAIPEAILRKPAPLTTEEQTLIRLHPALGSDLVASVPYLAPAAPVVRDAHERMDGRGYPRGIRAGDASVSARIIAVADAFDTMTRPRVFRDALNGAEALLELERCSGSQFDPMVVEAFRSVIAAQ